MINGLLIIFLQIYTKTMVNIIQTQDNVLH